MRRAGRIESERRRPGRWSPSGRRSGVREVAGLLGGALATPPGGGRPGERPAPAREAADPPDPSGYLLGEDQDLPSPVLGPALRRGFQEGQEHLHTATTMYRDMDIRYWLERAEAELS